LTLSREIGYKELIVESRMALLRHLDPRQREAEGEELLDLLTARHDLFRLKEVYWRLMWVYLSNGHFERCIECCDAGIRLAAELDAPPVMYPTLKALALLCLGRYGAAWESLQDEVAGAAHPFGSAFRDMGAGIYYLELSASDKAAGVFESVVEQARSLGRDWLRRWAQIQLARSLLRAGRLDEGNLERIAQDLASLGATLPSHIRAEISLADGMPEEALQQAETACAETSDRDRSEQASAWESRLGALLQLGRPGEVASLADEGIGIAEEMGYLAMTWRLRAAKALALAVLGDEGGAEVEYGAAAAIVRQLAEAIPDAELKENYFLDALVSSVLAAAGDS
jgi:tetratricopeptide (TPR) repeat protein